MVISYLFSIFLGRAGQKGAEQLSSLKESVLLSRIQIHVLEINTKYSIVGIHGVFPVPAMEAKSEPQIRAQSPQ